MTSPVRGPVANDLYSALVSGAEDAIVGCTVGGAVTVWNPAAEQLYGWTAREAIGRDVHLIVPADRQDELREITHKLARGGQVEPFETNRRRKDGGTVPVSSRASPMRDAGGRVTGVSFIDRRLSPTDRGDDALRESEARLARAQRIAGLGSWELDLITGQLTWSDEVYRLFGVRPDGFTPTRETFRELVYPDDRPRVAAAVEACVARGNPYDFDHRVVLPDGRVRVVNEQAEVTRDAGGRAVRMLGTVLDVTDRRRVEEALRESEERYRQLIEALPIGIYRTTPDGRVLLANPAAVRMAGCQSFDDLTRRDINVEKFHPDYPREEYKRRLAAESEIRGMELALRRPDGERVYLRENARAVRGPDGAVRYYEGTLEDITDRKRVEAALREREQFLRTILALMPAGVFWKDRESVYLGCNDRVARDYKITSPDQLVGKTDYELSFRKAEADFYQACDQKVIDTGQPMLDIEEEQTRPDGSTAVLLTSKVPLRDAAGAVVGVLGIYRDITDRKQLEEQYRQAQKMEAVGRLAGGVAHDFNNLLTAINGFSDLVLEALPPYNPARDLVREVRKAGDRAAELTRQLLAFSRQQVLAPRVLDLNAVVADLEKMLRRVIGEDVELVTDLPAGLWPVHADPGQVEQVLMNLTVNARDAMPLGGRLTITTRNVGATGGPDADPGLAPGRYAVLSVADTGCGMTPAVRDRVFEPFFTTKGPGRGTGLGLATAYGIVEQSGGRIAVETSPGRGTTFRVYLPRTELTPVAGPSHAGAAPLPKGGETVLLVEDESMVRDLTRRVLTGCGYRVLSADGGEQAVMLAGGEPGPLDILVTDVVMPGACGRELAERLRAGRPGLRVLFMSGYTDDEVVRHGLLHDEVNFLQKPFTPAALASKVREVLDSPVETMA